MCALDCREKILSMVFDPSLENVSEQAKVGTSYLKSPLMILFICNSPLMVDRDPTMKNPSISGIVKTMTTEMRLAGFAVPSNMYLYPTMAIAP